jgi:hypothetical protein
MDLPRHAIAKRCVAALLGTFTVLWGTHVAAQQAQGRAPLSVTVTCEHTPWWVFNGADNLPRKASQPQALLGQRFDVIGGLRTTLGGFQYWETSVIVVEPGYNVPGYQGPLGGPAHYWLSADCALPDRYVPR